MTTAMKKPQDHKISFDEMDGSELLLSPSKVKGSDQLRIISRLKDFGLMDMEDTTEDGAEKEVDIDSLDFDKVADFIDYVAERFAKDKEKFEEWTCGKGGFERAMNLTVAYAEFLGE